MPSIFPGTAVREVLGSFENGYAILQLGRKKSLGAEDMEYLFSSLRYLESKGLVPKLQNYAILYRAALAEDDTENLDDPRKLNCFLEGLFYTFNVDRPEDFEGHSMSVSDIVAIKRRENLSYYYVDSIGFKELVNFAE